MSAELLQATVVPTCFVLAGLLGLRLGTPLTVAVGVALVGCCHLAGLVVAAQAGTVVGTAGTVLHVASQALFAGGFAALVSVALTYPLGGRPPALVWWAAAVAVLGPVVGSLAGPTATVYGDSHRGPLADVLPSSLARVSDISLASLAILAVGGFALRYARAPRGLRPMMRWPLFGVAVVGVLATAGVLLGTAFPTAASVTFLLAAPVVPLALTLGPVRRRLLTLTEQTSRLTADLAARVADLEESRRRLSVAAEAERCRIERDLHDGAQQELLALIAHVEVARNERPGPELDRVATLARGAYETVRRVAHGIRPAVLDDLGLAGAVIAATDAFPVATTVEMDGLEGRPVDSAIEGAALFVVSEALANVLKHATAGHVLVRLVVEDHALRVTVEDDGRGGVDPEGAGVRGLCDRVEALGGRITIDSRPGRSCLSATFPEVNGA
jgi:signal transduction histidine kinase